MRSLMRSLADSFDDVAALIALYRPGPMAANMHTDFADRKNGRKPIAYLHPDMEELLGDTYGLMIYQESMMRVAQRFGGYSLAEADNLRKACGKKIRELMAREREKFVEACVATGYGETTKLFHHQAASRPRSGKATRTATASSRPDRMAQGHHPISTSLRCSRA
jgi:DNA polymerase-3 subunit alpha